MYNVDILVRELYALKLGVSNVEKIMQIFLTQEVKSVISDIKESEVDSVKQAQIEKAICDLKDQLSESNKKLAAANKRLNIIDVQEQIKNHPRNSSPWLGEGSDLYRLSDTIMVCDKNSNVSVDRVTGELVTSPPKQIRDPMHKYPNPYYPVEPVFTDDLRAVTTPSSKINTDECMDDIKSIVETAKQNLNDQGSILGKFPSTPRFDAEMKVENNTIVLSPCIDELIHPFEGLVDMSELDTPIKLRSAYENLYYDYVSEHISDKAIFTIDDLKNKDRIYDVLTKIVDSTLSKVTDVSNVYVVCKDTDIVSSGNVEVTLLIIYDGTPLPPSTVRILVQPESGS